MSKSKIIATSAVSASLVAISLTLGAYVSLLDVFSVVIASFFVILPLYVGSFKGCFLSYFVGGIIALVISGFNFFSIVFPSYFLYFGIYPIIRLIVVKKKGNDEYCEKESKRQIRKILIAVLGAVWTVAVFYGIYYYYTAVMNLPINDLPEFVANNVSWLIAVVGLIFYFVFDRFVIVSKNFYENYLDRIIKKKS